LFIVGSIFANLHSERSMGVRKALATLVICLFFSGCAMGVREKTAGRLEYIPDSMPQSAEKTGKQHPPGEHAVSSYRTTSSTGWNFDWMDHQLEPEVGLPISYAYIPMEKDFPTADEVSLDMEKHGLGGIGSFDPLSAPEMLEILTTESEHLLPLEEPEHIEDMVSQDVPSFLERMEGDGVEPSPLVELEKEMVHDIPVVINEYVQRYLDYFQNKARKNFRRWLARSHRYIPMMKNLMAEHGLPEDLVYMAMIESGFNPRAYSRAHAVGPWQFIVSTARKYGLRVDWWVDERKDPEKSTRAAIAYLKDLYNMFGSWYLAAASYNAGEGRISREVDRRRTNDFWILSRRSRRLKRETKAYIPKLIAAIIISKDPGKYGFTNIEPQEPLKFDRVTVQGSIDLRALAKACGTTYKKLKELNPELKHWITPPGRKDYYLKVPENTGIRFYQNLARMKPLKKITYGGYVVQRGDTISKIAYRFGSSVRTIMKANGIINPRRLRPGQKLFIPGRPVPIRPRDAGAVAGRRVRKPSNASRDKSLNRTHQLASSGGMKVHVLRKGETLWDIAQYYSLNVKELMKINNIRNPRRIREGIRLRIPENSSASRMVIESPPLDRQEKRTPGRASNTKPKEILYTVRKGDNIWTISRRYGIKMSNIFRWNNLDAKAQIYPGDTLRLIVNAEI